MAAITRRHAAWTFFRLSVFCMGRSKGLNPNGLYESGLDVVMIRRILFRPDTPNYPDGSLMSIATKFCEKSQKGAGKINFTTETQRARR
jgi:hypothetical protein